MVTGVVAHVGLHALGSFADRLRLGEALSGEIPPVGERLPVHDRGKALVQAMLTGGGEACSDIEALRAQPALFRPVASDSTLYRTFRQVTPEVLAGLRDAFAGVSAQVWARAAATVGAGRVVLDIDSTLTEVHSENKAEAAPRRNVGFAVAARSANAIEAAISRVAYDEDSPPSARTASCAQAPLSASSRR